jgi:hypothetical protein
MDEIQKLLAANLIEALRQIQDYVVLALGASVTSAALAFLPPSSSEEKEAVPVLVIAIPLPRSAAHLLLWALCLVGGFMAGNSAQLGYHIALKLQTVPGALAAIQTFPSVATSHMWIVNPGLFYIPPILAAVAVGWRLHQEKAPITAVGTMLAILLACYVPLWLQMAQLDHVLG